MKKLKLNIILIFSTILFFIAGMAVVMIVAPGADILGLKYIRSTSGSIDSEQNFHIQNVTDAQVVVNCDNILVKVNFVQSYNFSVRLIDVYNGYCKSGDAPVVAMEIKDGIYTFSVNEYKPFIYHNRSEESALYVNIPIYFIGSVNVVSNKSKIVVTGLKGNIYGLTLQTNGAVTVEDNFSTTNLNLVVGSGKVDISGNAKIKGDLNIESKNSNITCSPAIGGDIVLTGKGGRLKFNTCKNLRVKAQNTEILTSGENIALCQNADIETNDDIVLAVKGNANIKTKRGRVTLGASGESYSGEFQIETESGNVKMLGNYLGKTTILTKSGDVDAEWLRDANITTTYGKIDAVRVDSGKITAGGSGINILYSENKLNLKTRGGDIVLGCKDKYFYANVKAETTAGKIEVYNAKGEELNLKTVSGDINYSGSKDNITRLTISSNKGFVKATNLTGDTSIKTTGSVDCSIVSSRAETSIVGKNREIKVELLSTYVYDLQSSKKENIYINNTQVGQTTEEGGSEYIVRDNYKGEDKLTIKTQKGKINIKDNKN